MKEMSLDDIKACALEILRYFDKVCRDNNLTYYLCAGTLLGAIRHKGYIPWDDDIDVMMPRSDYERLFEVWPTTSHFHVLCHKNTRYFPYAYGKAIDDRTVKIEPIRKVCQHIGVDIDIFPIDNIPDEEKEAQSFFYGLANKQRALSRHVSSYGRSINWIRSVAHNIRVFLFRLLEFSGITSIDRLVEQYSSYAQRYNTEQTSFCGITTSYHYGIRERNRKVVYEGVSKVMFEGQEYPAPIGYKEYLTRLYGKDYGQLPPKEMRKTHHSYTAYWK